MRPADLRGHVPPAGLPVGILLGTVELVDCVPVGGDLFGRIADPLASGPWCWLLGDPRPLIRPISFHGKPGLFEVSDDLIA